jgi:hypothetical protein
LLFNVTDPVELTENVDVPDTNDIALTACATNVLVLNDKAYPLVVAKLAVVALTAVLTSVEVLNDCAYEEVVAQLDVVALIALTALATNVAVLKADTSTPLL